MRSRTHRSAFTLVEMLVALAIFLVLATMLAIAGLRGSDKNQVPKGAEIVQGMLAQAKTRALVEKRGVGVRFFIAAQNPPGFPPRPSVSLPNGMYVVDQLQYIHDPGDFADGYVELVNIHPVTGTLLVPTDRLYNRVIAGPPEPPAGGPYGYPYAPYQGYTFTNLATPPPYLTHTGPVVGGDSVEFNGGGQAFRVNLEDPASLIYLNRPAAADGTWDGPLTPPSPAVLQTIFHPTETSAGRTMLILDRRLDHPVQAPSVGTPRSNYRIIRQPRPIAGEAPVSLPREVAIIGRDLTGYYFDPPTNTYTRQSQPALFPIDVARGYVEIMFAPSGQVFGSSAEAIYLWLSDSPSAALDPNTGEPFDSNWAIVAVYTRTGGVAVYPVNQFVGPGANPYYFAQLGRGTGM